ncbi:LOW QUALITY PROTEIN: hypothetical protein V2J09_011649 [Rumex salicifolius]
MVKFGRRTTSGQYMTMTNNEEGTCQMSGCDRKVMVDDRGNQLLPCSECRKCYEDSHKSNGVCPKCKVQYKLGDYEDDIAAKRFMEGGSKRPTTNKSHKDANQLDIEEGAEEDNSCDMNELIEDTFTPLSSSNPIPKEILAPYRLLVGCRLISLGLFLVWRLQHPNDDAIWLWFMSIVCELWFAFSWLLDQIPKIHPLNRSTDLKALAHKFEASSRDMVGRSDLPGLDFFVSTADPEKEPPLVTANTILSILAVDYPVEKVSCYISDDGGSLLTFEAMAQASGFAELWVPFCRKHDIEPRNPESYFAQKGDPTKNKKRLDFVKDRRKVKREYEEFRVRINGLPDSIRRRSEAFNAREEMKIMKKMRDAKSDHSEPIRVQKATWMSDATHWPGTWIVPSKEHSKGDHAGILQVMLKPASIDPLIGDEDEQMIDLSGVDVRLPMLVYLSREKRPGYDHNKKAGAMNALVRASSILSNGPFILNLDCDHYIYNCKAVQEGMCFMLDRGGEDICYIQFPQRFEGIDPSDRYANRNNVFFDGNMRALDGLQGPVYVGTGCMFRRFALYGFDPPNRDSINETKEAKIEPHGYNVLDPNLGVNELPRRFGNSNMLIESIPVSEYQGRPLADHPSVMYGRPPGILRSPRQPLKSLILFLSSLVGQDRVGGASWMDLWISNRRCGYRMHNRGWRSVYCVTKRDAFRGSAPINLTDRLHQVLRWATGSVEIFFSRNNAVLASRRLMFLQRLAYLNVGIYPFTSLFLILYCFLPALSLYSGQFIVANLKIEFLVYLLIMTLCLIGLAILEVRWSGIELEEWWRNEQFWLISGTSSHLAAVVQGLLKVIAGIEISFTLTSKSSGDDEDDIFADLYLIKWTSLMIPPIVIAIVNIIAIIYAFVRTIYTSNPKWSKFVGGAFFSLWVLCHLVPFGKGLMGRRSKTPTIVFVWSGLLAITISLLYVAIDSSVGGISTGGIVVL